MNDSQLHTSVARILNVVPRLGIDHERQRREIFLDRVQPDGREAHHIDADVHRLRVPRQAAVTVAVQHQRALPYFRPLPQRVMTQHHILAVDRCECDVALRLPRKRPRRGSVVIAADQMLASVQTREQALQLIVRISVRKVSEVDHLVSRLYDRVPAGDHSLVHRLHVGERPSLST